MIGRNDPCWCGSGKKWKKCCFPQKASISQRTGRDLSDHYKREYGILLKTPSQIEGIRAACKLTAEVLDEACAMVKPGVTTNEIDAYCHKRLTKAGAIPAPLNYGTPPYPKSICTSVNEVICHGIPDDTPLKEGDIVGIDISCSLNGYFGDCCKTVPVGQVSSECEELMKVTLECLEEAAKILRPGIIQGQIGTVIESHAVQHGCTVVREFIGHGVGLQLHENPQILHYKNNNPTPLVPGMTFTVEPMINSGRRESHLDEEDGWTVTTVDGKPSAQFEHTFLIVDGGCEILTPWKDSF